jgi:DNA-binding Xre family transcriptional regulator
MARLRIDVVAGKKGIIQKVLAARSGCTIQVINRYWNNNVQRVDLAELDKIAKALGVTPGELIGPEETDQK